MDFERKKFGPTRTFQGVLRTSPRNATSRMGWRQNFQVLFFCPTEPQVPEMVHVGISLINGRRNSIYIYYCIVYYLFLTVKWQRLFCMVSFFRLAQAFPRVLVA